MIKRKERVFHHFRHFHGFNMCNSVCFDITICATSQKQALKYEHIVADILNQLPFKK